MEPNSCGSVLVEQLLLAGMQVEVSPEKFCGRKASGPGRAWKAPEVYPLTEWRTVEDQSCLGHLGSTKSRVLVLVCDQVFL